MKDEIKEILDSIRKIIKSNRENEFDRIIYDCDSIEQLLDYITNLQTIEQQYSAILSENAELENKINELQEELEEEKRIEQASLDTINNLQDTLKDREEYCYGLETQLTDSQEENKKSNNIIETLKETNKLLINQKYKLEYELDMLDSKRDKAIEYIEENCIDDEFHINLTNKEKHILTALNILQGSDIDESKY